MQKINDFIYYNRKEILLVFVSIIVLLSFVLKESDSKIKEQVDLSIKDTSVVEEKESIKEKIIVDIKGEVNSPGTYEMNENDRIIDVIEKSGGLTKTASVDNINLSEKVKDEMVIIIPSINEEKEVEIKQEKKTNYVITKNNEPTDKKISINTASIQTLMSINGVGEKKAAAIVEYRTKNGPFKSIEDIMNVSGIGQSTFDKIKEYIKI